MAVVCPEGHADTHALLGDLYQCVICGVHFDPLAPPTKKGKK